jgi:Amt family ammonium transporter
MHLGFASLESGLTRQKNTINILFKNTMIISIGLLTYALIGFNVMYPGFADDSAGILSLEAIPNFITLEAGDPGLTPQYGNYTWYTDFFFQAMFAATCATIVSGSVAGRVKLSSFLIFSTCLLIFCYPVTGSWVWGGGWLDGIGFYDFAGSTLVHSVGGWAALVMAWLLGPRLGKYNADGSANAIPGSNMPLVAVGVFLLWFGWFGFNGGSVLSADPATTSLVLVTTSMAAAAGGLAAGLVSWTQGKPDVTMALNGILAGLVGVTASADSVTIQGAVIIGAIAGVIVYFSVIIIDKKIDDPVGAVSVHLVCGIWGTIAVGIFGGGDLVAQLTGIVAIGAYTVIFTLIVGSILKATLGIRVSASEEEVGLDVSEHGMKAYN